MKYARLVIPFSVDRKWPSLISSTCLVKPLDNTFDVPHFVEAFVMFFGIPNSARAVVFVLFIRFRLISQEILVIWVQTLAFTSGVIADVVEIPVCKGVRIATWSCAFWHVEMAGCVCKGSFHADGEKRLVAVQRARGLHCCWSQRTVCRSFRDHRYHIQFVISTALRSREVADNAIPWGASWLLQQSHFPVRGACVLVMLILWFWAVRDGEVQIKTWACESQIEIPIVASILSLSASVQVLYNVLSQTWSCWVIVWGVLMSLHD